MAIKNPQNRTDNLLIYSLQLAVKTPQEQSEIFVYVQPGSNIDSLTETKSEPTNLNTNNIDRTFLGECFVKPTSTTTD